MKTISYKINRNQPHTNKRQLIKVDVIDNTEYYNSEHFNTIRELWLKLKIVRKQFS